MLTGRRGECGLPELVSSLGAAMPEQAVLDCLKVFEARNKLMVADRTVFMI